MFYTISTLDPYVEVGVTHDPTTLARVKTLRIATNSYAENINSSTYRSDTRFFSGKPSQHEKKTTGMDQPVFVTFVEPKVCREKKQPLDNLNLLA
jgi:hypothetical protein